MQVFVSSAHSDRARVLPICDKLETAGFTLWIDRTGISGGSNYGPEIVAAIRHSSAMLVMCTAAAFHSRNVRQEIALAWKYECPTLPLRLDPVEPPDDFAYWLEAS